MYCPARPHGLTSMSRRLAMLKSSTSSADVRVVYRRKSSQPAFSEMAVGLHLQGNTFVTMCVRPG